VPIDGATLAFVHDRSIVGEWIIFVTIAGELVGFCEDFVSEVVVLAKVKLECVAIRLGFFHYYFDVDEVQENVFVVLLDHVHDEVGALENLKPEVGNA
jgi:hypothetical protein